MNNTIRVGKEEEIHDHKARRYRNDEKPTHEWTLKLQVHEVSDDQRGLNH
jgi:hypothetical protein